MTHELRRHDLEITDAAEIDRILSAARYATIALVDGEQPYVVTLSCGYDAASRKLCTARLLARCSRYTSCWRTPAATSRLPVAVPTLPASFGRFGADDLLGVFDDIDSAAGYLKPLIPRDQ